MDSIVSLKAQLQKDIDTSPKRGKKAILIRRFVTNLSIYMGLKRLHLESTYVVAINKLGSISKSHFLSVVKSTWSIEIDEHKTEWIRVDQPKRR